MFEMIFEAFFGSRKSLEQNILILRKFLNGNISTGWKQMV